MSPNLTTEITTLLDRWRNGEDVQDAMAHKLRFLISGVNTLKEQRDRLIDSLIQLRDTTSCTQGQYLIIDKSLISELEIERDDESDRKDEERHAERHHSP